MAKVSILGTGGFGVSLAATCFKYGHQVTLWGLFPDEVNAIIRDGEHKKLLPGVPVNPGIRVTADIGEAAGADLLILLSDIDGLFSDDPRTNPQAQFIDEVDSLDEHFLKMGKESTGSKVGTGGMATKLSAAKIATSAGADMVIANGRDPHVLHKIVEGEDYGTLFAAKPKEEFYLLDYIKNMWGMSQNDG